MEILPNSMAFSPKSYVMSPNIFLFTSHQNAYYYDQFYLCNYQVSAMIEYVDVDLGRVFKSPDSNMKLI